MTFKLRTITILVVYVGNIIALDAVKILDCTLGNHPDAILEHVAITNCNIEKDPYCTFVRGTNASMTAEFKTTQPFASANVGVYALIGRMKIPFHLKPDACANYGVNCPSAIGENQTLKASLPVLKNYPKIKVSILVQMFDEKNNPIICIQFPAKVR